MSGMIDIKDILMHRRAIIAVFFIPRTLTSVFIPVYLSASASSISLVVVPPNKNNAAMQPTVTGTF